MVKKVLIDERGKKFFWERGDFHTQFGYVKEKDIKNKKIVETHLGKKFYVVEPKFIDLIKKIKRGPQIPMPKDIAIIIYYSSIDKNSIVVDAGTGCGFLAISLARFVKKVVSYEVNKHYIKIARENIKLFNAKNVKIKNKNIEEGIDEKNVDLVVLDLPEPWKVLDHAQKALKSGAFLVCYLPTIVQVMKLVEYAKRRNFIVTKVLEILERGWFVEEKKVRPKNKIIGHSAFIVFSRRI